MSVKETVIFVNKNTIKNDIDMVCQTLGELSFLKKDLFKFTGVGDKIEAIKLLQAPLLLVAEAVDKTQFAKDNFDVLCGLIETALNTNNGHVVNAIEFLLISYEETIRRINPRDKDAEQQKYIAQFVFLPIVSDLVSHYVEALDRADNDENFDDDSDIEIMTGTTFH